MKFSKQDLSRYPILITTGVVVLLGVLIWAFTRSDDAEQENLVPEDAIVADTLALNILCTPTLECLPLYYAVESGLCDSLHLPLIIRTENAQFDVDSIMRKTSRFDGGILDMTRLAHYRTSEKGLKSLSPKQQSELDKKHQYYRLPMPTLTQLIVLDGQWRLVSSAQLRIRSVDKINKRTVAAARFCSSDDCLKAAIRGTKVKYDNIYHAQINDFNLRLNMLDEAQIDASVLPEPYATMAALRGHQIIWRTDSMRNTAIYIRNKALAKKGKKQQVELLKKAYNLAVADLNKGGAKVADSALIKVYHLPQSVIDTLRLPYYHKTN